MSCLSNLLILPILCSYSFLSSSPCRLNPVTSSIHPESRSINFPASGSLLKYLQRKGFLRSSLVGRSIDATLKNLGSIFCMICPMALPFPAVPQPSTSTSTGILCSARSVCCSESLFLAAFSLSFNSSFSGLSPNMIFFSIVPSISACTVFQYQALCVLTLPLTIVYRILG